LNGRETVFSNDKHLVTVLGDKELADQNDEPEQDEQNVGEHSSKDVKFIVNLTGSKHVENLHEHKGVEHESHVA
jgi:hypothetical protein